MKKKIILVLFAIILLCGCSINLNNEEVENVSSNDEESYEVCDDSNIKSYVLNFNTNGGEEIDSKSICISCEVVEELPTPVKEGYTFDGWYTNESLNDGSYMYSIDNINPIGIYDDDACLTGYEEITLYAKWN